MTPTIPATGANEMTDAEITALLAKRDKLLTRRDGLYDSKRVANIEKKLSVVELGRNNEVDLALGRPCAVIENYAPLKPGWFANPAVTLADPDTQALIDKTRQLWRDAEAIEY